MARAHHAAALITFAILVAGATAQAPAPSPAAARATLEVADTDRFCPTTWRLRIAVPRDHEAIRVPVPLVSFERKDANGEWTSATKPPRGTTDPDPVPWSVFDDSSSCGGVATEPWQLAPGATMSIAGEVADFHVIAYPGSYRARSVVTFGSATQEIVSAEFTVGAKGACGDELAKAQTEQTPLWTAYKQLMHGRLLIKMPPATRIGEPTREGAAAISALFEQWSAPWNVLGRAPTLPAAVRDRVDAVRLGPMHTIAWNRPAADRPAALTRLLADCKSLGAKPGFTGAFARLQLLVFLRAHGTPAEFEAALAAARSDGELLEVARGFPTAMRDIGLADQFGARGEK